jgi:hypothetical protein
VTATGCSITSTATVSATLSTTGATGGLTFRAAFFTGAGLGLAVRFVAFPRAALPTLRALPRFAEFLFRSFPRFCTPFFRLAMIRPGSGWWSATHDVGLKSHGNALNDLSTDRSLSAAYQALFFPGRTERSLFFERKVGGR